MSSITHEGTAGGGNVARTGRRSGLARDDVFEVLRNRRRRFALHYLKRNGQRADLGALSEHVAAWENSRLPEDVTSDERKRVYTSLQQFHLPKMDDVGVVEYDRRAGTVSLRPPAADLDVYLEVVRDDDVPWSQFYVVLALVNAVIVAAAWFGVPPLSQFAGIVWATFVVATFLTAAMVHAYLTETRMQIGATDVPPEVDR